MRIVGNDLGDLGSRAVLVDAWCLVYDVAFAAVGKPTSSDASHFSGVGRDHSRRSARVSPL